jgi:xanthine dehydrogenase molybdopterin-binding subunit B
MLIKFYFLRTGKPVRCMLDRHEDMSVTGGRNPFLCQYNVGFNEDGIMQVLDMSVYCNAGSSRDLSTSVIIDIFYKLIFSYCDI